MNPFAQLEKSGIEPCRGPVRASASRRSHVASIFEATIRSLRFPCVAAKGALARDQIELGVYRRIGDQATTIALCNDFYEVSHPGLGRESSGVTFAAVFMEDSFSSEAEFHDKLWEQLDLITVASRPLFSWSPSVSENRADPNYAFSFAEEAYFVIGMSPVSKRVARRFPWAALIFNPRSRFEEIRTKGTFETMKRTIRHRDFGLDGTPNPLLADHGTTSEARQYSAYVSPPGCSTVKGDD